MAADGILLDVSATPITPAGTYQATNIGVASSAREQSGAQKRYWNVLSAHPL